MTDQTSLTSFFVTRILSFVLIPHLESHSFQSFEDKYSLILLDKNGKQSKCWTWNANGTPSSSIIIKKVFFTFITFKGSMSKALWGVMKRGILYRWFVTKRDRLANGWLPFKTIVIPSSSGCLPKTIDHSIVPLVMSKTRIYFL